MISIIRDKRDVTKTRLWEAYRDMVKHYEDALSRLSDYVEAQPVRAKCPSCGVPTVPDHQDLTPDAATCDGCYSTRKQGAV